ncbi:MFS transporter [Phenylobacterium sp. LjRoot225]|uniref:MFS transporter n=1 Tax=Phenylobacterium sp. LjRoot225 TaxID=3342285 RepID=UPI003ECCC12D
MGYFGEFRTNWQALLATFVGIATGNALSHYTMSMFAPELIKEFGWSRAQFALVGSLPMITMFLVPFAGRFTDRFGARVSATVGFAAISLGFLALSAMTGNIVEFFAIWVVQHVFGVLTTSLVFTRVIVERFDKARGSGLSLLMIGPPLSGAIVAPVLGNVIEAEGWRAAFVGLAVVSGLGGLICATLLGRSKRADARAATDGATPKKTPYARLTRAEVLAVARHPAFLLIVGGMFLINIPQVFAASQIKLIVLANGVPDGIATWMVSLYAIGVIIGRVIFGLALDRVRANVVALFALSLPAVGFFVLASPVAAVGLLAAAVLVIGMAQGAEGDIGAYMVSRHFELKNYSLIFGFVKSALDGGGAVGSLILSYTLHTTDSYASFLMFSAATTVIGAVCFFLAGGGQPRTMRSEPIATEARVT